MKHASRWVVVGGMLIGGVVLAASLSDFKDAVGKGDAIRSHTRRTRSRLWLGTM